MGSGIAGEILGVEEMGTSRFIGVMLLLLLWLFLL
jgi:hypothetical protein